VNDLNPIEAAIGDMDKSNATALREKVVRLEEEMRKLPQIELKTTHHFAPGIYAREIFIPAGTSLTGKIHRTDHINCVSQGDITVLTDEGMKRIKAPCTFVASAGTKRAGFAHEDTVWTTYHANPTDERNLEKLEAELIVPTFEELPPAEDARKLKEG
jgi:hypothetical protein